MAASAEAVPVEVRDRFSDQRWRLNNLYKVTTKEGRVVPFRMNWAQEQLYDQLWFRNLVLKARQLGMSTFIDVLELDTCLFNSGIQAGVIAHDRESAEELFSRNIKTPYDHLPDQLKIGRPADSRSARKLAFNNGSSIRVGTSMRSGTLQMLHVSEMGKICARYPEKAREIVTGSFEAVPIGGVIVVESTAEGRDGWFHDACQEAIRLRDAGTELTRQDAQLVFYPWWQHPEYRLTPREARGVVVNEKRKAYFDRLQAQLGVTIDAMQRAWWVKKAIELGDDIYREYPATEEEAFYAAVHGTYYGDLMAAARQEGRITAVPYEEAVGVETWWDHGLDDETSIWFVQRFGRNYRVIDHYANSGETLAHYVRVLQERGYIYSAHYVPHDARNHTDISTEDTPLSRLKVMKALGLRNVIVVDRPRNNDELGEQINAVRTVLPSCWFDAERCDEGIKSLEQYRKEWDERLVTYKNRPLHNWASHGADAFRTGVVGGALARRGRVRARQPKKTSARGWT